MKLTSAQVKIAKPKSKPYKLSDGKGLYLLVKINGSKLWRMDYTFNHKRNTHSIGTYPALSLAKARIHLLEVKDLIEKNIDPNLYRKITKASATENTFKAVALERHAKFSPNWSEGYGKRVLRRLEKDIFPWLGSRQIDDIKAPELLITMQRAESRGAHETAHRIRQECGQIFRYAVATGRAQQDISISLIGALPPLIVTHHPSITDPKKIGALLRAIDGYEGSFITRCALQLAPLVFLRPGELRQAEWSEINIEHQEWRIPKERMKLPTPHIVPLSTQAIKILTEIKPLTGSGKYIFPGIRSATRPMSDNTMNAALRRLGYTKEEMTSHGFRSMASTLLNEKGWNSDAIERQLAHCERNGIRAAYNYAEYLPERSKMMQAWSNYLDTLRHK